MSIGLVCFISMHLVIHVILTSFWQISRALLCSKWAALCKGVYLFRPSMLTLVVLWFSKACGKNGCKTHELWEGKGNKKKHTLTKKYVVVQGRVRPLRFRTLRLSSDIYPNLTEHYQQFHLRSLNLTSTTSTFPVRTAACSGASSLWSLRLGFAWLWRRYFTVLTCPADTAQWSAVLP